MNLQETPFLIPMTKEELWQQIRLLLREELITSKQNKVEYTVPGMTQKPIFKAGEVCEMLQVTRQTLHTWDKEGILKHHKIKSRTFYLWSDIEALMNKDIK